MGLRGKGCQPGVPGGALDGCGAGEGAGLGIWWTCQVNSERWHRAGVKARAVSHIAGIESWLLHFVVDLSVPQDP